MAIINKTGIGDGNTIQAEHVTRVIDALSSQATTTIAASGSFTGSFTGTATITSAAITSGTATLSSATINGTLINGQSNTAGGSYSHAEGWSTTSTGQYSHAEGYNATASGNYSHAEGYLTSTNNEGSHAEGHQTKASGNYSHTEGYYTLTTQLASHAEGYNATASANYSHAEGGNTTTTGNYSHAEGEYSVSSGRGAHAEGLQTVASNDYSNSKGNKTLASGRYSLAIGQLTTASADQSFASGFGTIASANGAHAQGQYTTASGNYSHAEGLVTLAVGTAAHAEGRYTTASGNYSHAEGDFSEASGSNSHAEGIYTLAIGYGAHSEGRYTTASANYSHAEGVNTETYGLYSHAEGDGTIAKGDYSHASGRGTISSGSAQNVVGHYNTYGDNTSFFIIGDGTSDVARSDVFKAKTNAIEITGSLSILKGGGALNIVGTDHTYIQMYPDGFASGRKAYIGYASAPENDLTIANEFTVSESGIRFKIGGSDILYMSGSGNVGVGTNSPMTNLDIRGTNGNGKVLSVTSGSATPDLGYSGAIVTTLPAGHGQHINLVRNGQRAYSIGFLPGTSKFMIAWATESIGSTIADPMWNAQSYGKGGYVQDNRLHGFNTNWPSHSIHIDQTFGITATGIQENALAYTDISHNAHWGGSNWVTTNSGSVSLFRMYGGRGSGQIAPFNSSGFNFYTSTIVSSSAPLTTAPIASRLFISASGYIGIGTETPTHQLTLSTDSAAKPSTNTWTISSDIRLKENIEEANYDTCYDVIKNLPLKRYTWKSDAYTADQVADRSKLGWIAQDVQTVFPKAVTSNSFSGSGDFYLDDCLTMNADQIYAAMYGTIKKLIVENETLKSELQTIKTHLGL